MKLQRMKLNSKMIMPLRELVGVLLEQLEIAEKEIDGLVESNDELVERSEHYQRSFDEVSEELERMKRNDTDGK